MVRQVISTLLAIVVGVHLFTIDRILNDIEM